MKCWPFGDPWACTTATWAVTCCPFWCWPFGDVVIDSATRICESLESPDSIGTTSITLTLPDGAVCRIIFFCLQITNYATFKNDFNEHFVVPDSPDLSSHGVRRREWVAVLPAEHRIRCWWCWMWWSMCSRQNHRSALMSLLWNSLSLPIAWPSFTTRFGYTISSAN